TPYLCQGIDYQPSLVMNSLSQYIGGHANALGGAITNTGLYDWSNYEAIAEPYRKGDPYTCALTQIKETGSRHLAGAASSDAAHRISVGAETMALRMEKACSNAMALAKYLEQHSKVVSVNYPGLASHPQHVLASEYFKGRYGALMGI